MVRVRFIEHDGVEHLVEGAVGSSVMQAARDNLVPGIIGDCGGNASCATCHGYIDPAWLGELEPIEEQEELMLDGAMNREGNSRLTCQVRLKSELDGIVVRLPASQT